MGDTLNVSSTSKNVCVCVCSLSVVEQENRVHGFMTLVLLQRAKLPAHSRAAAIPKWRRSVCFLPRSSENE
jgi:hypothetical protein